MKTTSFLSKIERLLIIAAVFGLLTLICVQALLTIDPVGFYSNVAEEVEGEEINFYEEFPETRVTSSQYDSVFATVTVQIENYSYLEKAVLLVNGKEVADFRDKSITVKVKPEDILAIDGSFYEHELVFKVASASENVVSPEIGKTVTVSGDVEIIGKVELK